MTTTTTTKHFQVVPVKPPDHDPFKLAILMTPSFAVALKHVLRKGLDHTSNRGVDAVVAAIEGQLGQMSDTFVKEPMEVKVAEDSSDTR